MTQPMPERPAPPARSGDGNPLTRKVGPLPTWGWLALLAAGGVGYIWWRNRQAASTAAATDTTGTTATDTTGSATDDAASIATLQSEIQQLQGEESTDTDNDKTGGGTSSGGKTRTITVGQRQTLAQLARRRKWPAARLRAAEALNGLSASSELHKGQVLKLPA